MGKMLKIEQWYRDGLWTRQQVLDAVGRWLTQEEADAILAGDSD